MIIAPIAGAVGLTLVTASHVIPIAMAQELAPSYTPENADVFDTFAAACLLLNYFGNVFNWAVATPLYAVAILTTGRAALGGVPRVDRGRLRRLARSLRPLSSVIEGPTSIGFLAFFAFLVGMGITILRRRVRRPVRTRRASPETPLVPADRGAGA